MMKAALHSIVGSDEKLQASVDTILATVTATATADAAVDATGEAQVSASPIAPAPPKPCESRMSCDTCVFEGQGCAWCIMGRRCVPDRAWECQGEQDHVGLGGVGLHVQCPNIEHEDAKRAERKRRKAEAAIKVRRWR